TPLRLSRLNPAEFKWTIDKLLTGQTVVVRTRADVPEEAAHVIQVLRNSGVHSFTGIPLTVDQRVVGALFFSSAQEREWDPALLEELKFIAAIVGGGLERSRSHAALVESEHLKRSILASLPSSVVVLDPHGIIIALNGSSANLPFESGFCQEVLQVGSNYLELCRKAASQSEDAKAALKGLRSVFSGETGRFVLEYPWKTALQERWFRMSIVPLHSDAGGVVVTHTDVTEQKLAELERKQLELARGELSGRLIRAQEEERTRVARELHDDINQKLGLLAIEIETLEQNLPANENQVQHKLAELFKTTNRISSDVQRLSHQLHSSRLDYLGLPAALRRLCEEFATQHNIFTECLVDDSAAKLVRETGLCLFRIAQECLNNVARHSSASRVRVRLQCLGDVVRMEISDNGTGFDVERENMRRDPGLGLISMHERLRLVKGELSIDSEKGNGTQITASVPLETEGRSIGGENLSGQSLPA
ncbi:MAG: ATP-binding protein, partial [Actinomycetota bacterium]